jgi:hypothetical protein
MWTFKASFLERCKNPVTLLPWEILAIRSAILVKGSDNPGGNTEELAPRPRLHTKHKINFCIFCREIQSLRPVSGRKTTQPHQRSLHVSKSFAYHNVNEMNHYNESDRMRIKWRLHISTYRMNDWLIHNESNDWLIHLLPWSNANQDMGLILPDIEWLFDS